MPRVRRRPVAPAPSSPRTAVATNQPKDLIVKHVALVFYASDFRDASQRRADGVADRYRHHTYSIESWERMQQSGVQVSIIQMHSSESYRTTDPAGLRFVGLGAADAAQAAPLLEEYVRKESVTHVVVLFPSHEILEAALRSTAQVGVVLADSFPAPWRNRARYARLGVLLSDPGTGLVANHHHNASWHLVDTLGLDPRRVLPWDWPMDLTDLAAGSARDRREGRGIRLCYAGSISRIKGVWDVLHAMALLRLRGHRPTLDLAGDGDTDHLRRLVERLHLQDAVTHHGVVGGDDVVTMMQSADFVTVPSRHSYPEGLPLTIFEGMASGTPLITSDHPMFEGVVQDGETGFVFRAGRPVHLASTILRAWRDPQQYAQVSRTAASTYAGLGTQPLWGDLIARWVRGSADDHDWISAHSLDRRSRR